MGIDNLFMLLESNGKNKPIMSNELYTMGKILFRSRISAKQSLTSSLSEQDTDAIDVEIYFAGKGTSIIKNYTT